MKFVMYSSFDVVDTFVVENSTLDDFLYLYEIFDGGYNRRNFILDINNIEYGEPMSVKEWLEGEGNRCSWKEFCDYEPHTEENIKTSLIKLCNFYNVNKFYIDDKNILKGEK